MNVKALASACCPPFLRPTFERIEHSPIGYRLAKGVFWCVAGAVISRGMMFVAVVVVAHMLGPVVYGEFGIIRSTVNMFVVFAGFGLGLTASKHVAECRETDPARAGRIMAMSSVFAWVTGGLVAAVVVALAPWLAAQTLNAPHLTGVLRIAALILLINSANGAQTGALAGFEAFKTIARVNLGVGLSSFPLLVGGAYLGGLTGVVWALAINMAINWLLNHLALRKEAASFHVAFTLRQCTAEWSVLWQFSLPVVAAGVMVAPAQWVCNAFLVHQEGGYAQMGVFSAVMIFQTTILFAGEMLSAPLLAMLCNAEGQVSDRLGRVNMLSSWCIAVMVIVPLLCFPEIAELLFGKAYGGAAFRTTFVLMMFYTCILMFKQGLARVLAANSLMWWGFLSNSIWAVVAIGLAWHLVAWGAMGLAASFAIAYGVNTLLLVPLYHFRRLVPSGTLVSAESLVIWGILAALTLLGLADVSLLVRGIALVPSLLFVAIAFVRIAKPRLQAEA